MRYSKQCEEILDYLHSTRSHPCADTIYAELRKIRPNISLGTVYRNLSKLYENGDILKIDTGSGKDHFDGFAHQHYHFVCKGCDSVYDVEMPQIAGADEAAQRSLGFTVEGHSMIFFGSCKECSENK